MPEYLSKEEVKQWRSSLEKITLEEYAARLGKVIEEEKQTNDLVDIILKSSPVMSRTEDLSINRGEKISSIAKKSFEREKEISGASLSSSINDKIAAKKADKTIAKKAQPIEKNEPVIIADSTIENDDLRNEVRVLFAKALTEREQLVFDHFAKNKNQIVYAKDLAKLLDLPRDYVYKYIKNLRAKIEGDKLQNSDNGGYILSI